MGYVIQSIGQSGSWTPAFTGFSADPSGITARYTLNGKWCTVYFTATGNGTSNATTFTMTLPFTSASAAFQQTPIRVLDNGTVQTSPGLLKISASSSTADIFKTLANGAFTNTGAKSCSIAGFTYEIA